MISDYERYYGKDAYQEAKIRDEVAGKRTQLMRDLIKVVQNQAGPI